MESQEWMVVLREMVRAQRFPSPEAVETPLHLEWERQEGQWKRRLHGFMEAQEELKRIFQARCPHPQTMIQPLEGHLLCLLVGGGHEGKRCNGHNHQTPG